MEENVLEEYYKDIEKLDRRYLKFWRIFSKIIRQVFVLWSLSVELLTIYLKLKEKMILKKNRKFEATYNVYLKKSVEDRRNETLLRIFLEKIRETLFEISTRLYEEERKKAENEARMVILYKSIPVMFKVYLLLQDKDGVLNVSNFMILGCKNWKLYFQISSTRKDEKLSYRPQV